MWAARVHEYVCVHICGYKGDMAFTPPGVYGNAKRSDDTVTSVPLNRNSSVRSLTNGTLVLRSGQ